MSAPGQDQAIAWLGDPANHGGAPVSRIETHGAMVFLAGERALKIKRAVRLPYLDFSTLERRHAACAAEMRLNQPGAPQIYRRLVPLVQTPRGLQLGGAGEVVEWVVEMRRFPQDALLEQVVARGGLDRPLAQALGRTVAATHAAAPARAHGSRHMRRVLEVNCGALRDRVPVLDATRVEDFTARATAAFERLAPLMDRRAEQGFVRRCHGDLHLGNIVLLDGRPLPFDALEFDEDLGSIDVLYDLAFLLMDLEHRRCRAAANAVLNAWCEASGDYGGLALLPFFLALRAAIRAHIRALRASMGDAEGGADARALLDEAMAYLAPPPPQLLAVGGFSGSGKSTLAFTLAPALGAAPGAVVLRSDAIRKRQAGIGELDRLPSSAYTPQASQAVYTTMRERAAMLLAAGHSVVADAVQAKPAERAAIEAVARNAGAAFSGVWLDAPGAELTRRVEARTSDVSDATAQVVAQQLSYETGEISWRRLDAARGAEAVAAQARQQLGLAAA
jgi:aminoglycoside phosphotransferase family enzyme/predicted kinase